MLDLRNEGPVSVMFLKIDPVKDCEGQRRSDGENDGWAHLSFDSRVLQSILGRDPTTIRKGAKVLENLPSVVERVVAVEPIGDCVLALYWQNEEQVARNPIVDDGPDVQVQRIRRPLAGK